MSCGGEKLQRSSAEPVDGTSQAEPGNLQTSALPLHSDARELVLKPSRFRPDPLARVRALGERQNRLGMTVGLAFALSVHGAAAAHGYTALIDLGAFAALVQSTVRDDIRATYAVEVAPAKPPPPPPEAPPPPEPEPQPKAVSRNPQAGSSTASSSTSRQSVDGSSRSGCPLGSHRGWFCHGRWRSLRGRSHLSQRHLYDRGQTDSSENRRQNWQPRQRQTRQRRDATGSFSCAQPADTSWNDCGFPPEADTDQINFMRVRIMVTVGVDGRAQKVTVLNDPGHGFGRQAQQCAFRKGFDVALNSDGKPVVSTTPPFNVTFTR